MRRRRDTSGSFQGAVDVEEDVGHGRDEAVLVGALEVVVGGGEAREGAQAVDKELDVLGLDADEFAEALTKDGDFVLQVGRREGAGFGEL